MNLHLGTLTRYYTAANSPDERDPEVVAGAVSAWRHWINKELPHPLDWNESPTAPFETAAMGEASYHALCLLAGYAQPHAALLPDDLPTDDSAVRALGADAAFSQVFQPVMWLPGEHDFLFQTRDLGEEMIWIGSSSELIRQIEDLGQFWKSELATREIWRQSFEQAAELLVRLAQRSVRYGLPLRLTGSDSGTKQA